MTTLDTRGLLPSQAMMDAMGRRRHQNPPLKKTDTKNPRWYFRYRVDVLTEPGVTKYVEREKGLGYCSDIGKRAAEKLQTEFLATINRPDVVIQSQVSFGAIIDRWLKYAEQAVLPDTFEEYRGAINKHIRPEFGNLRLCDITAEDAQLWLLKVCRANSKCTARHIRARFSGIWKKARVWGYTRDASPLEDATMGTVYRRQPRKKTLPTVEQFNALLALLSEPTRTIVTVAAFTGLRISEILGLSWEDLSRDTVKVQRVADRRGIIYDRTKTERSERLIPIGHVRHIVLQLEKPANARAADPAFRIKYNPVLCRIKAAAGQIGIDYEGFGCHTFRRLHNTWFRRSASTEDAMEQLGHADKKTNDLYNVEDDVDVQRRAGITEKLMGKVTGGVQ